MAISIEPSVRVPKWEGGKITNDEDDTNVVIVIIVSKSENCDYQEPFNFLKEFNLD